MGIEQPLVSWEHPGFGIEVKVLRIPLTHEIKNFSKFIFATKNVHAREMIYTLMDFELRESINML